MTTRGDVTDPNQNIAPSGRVSRKGCARSKIMNMKLTDFTPQLKKYVDVKNNCIYHKINYVYV